MSSLLYGAFVSLGVGLGLGWSMQPTYQIPASQAGPRQEYRSSRTVSTSPVSPDKVATSQPEPIVAAAPPEFIAYSRPRRVAVNVNRTHAQNLEPPANVDYDRAARDVDDQIITPVYVSNNSDDPG